MADTREQAVLKLAETIRIKADAFIVLGLLPGGRFFYSVDPDITLPDLHGELAASVKAVCGSVSRTRARIAKERKSS